MQLQTYIYNMACIYFIVRRAWLYVFHTNFYTDHGDGNFMHFIVINRATDLSFLLPG